MFARACLNYYTGIDEFELQEKLIQKFKQENEELRQKIKEWENWKASSKDRHAKGREKTKNPTKPKKW